MLLNCTTFLSATYHNYSFVYNISKKTYVAQFVNLDKQEKRKNYISKTKYCKYMRKYFIYQN